MRKILFFSLIFFAAALPAQQLPEFTQFPSILWQINPAYTGTKSTIDARLDYRKQWMGYDGAPVTQFAGVNSRLWKGRLGVGGTLYKDETGPSRRFIYSFQAAYHLKLPDVEFCAGFSMNFDKYTLDETKMTTHWTNDPLVNNTLIDFDKNKNATGGVLLYNDRFHFGLAITNFIDTHADFFTTDTTGSRVNYKAHYYFTCGYNFNKNPDYVWENNIMGTYVAGLPMTLDYNLRVHYKEKILAGFAWRLRDALSLQAGYVLFESVQVIYSYDFGISPLRKAHSGTHELMIGYRWNFGQHKGGYRNFDDFQKQKYHIF
ncbi:MAG TPA: type IX secretion system membrane protein PorP/SprF [Bacteroidia bacterium]|nr:type IX secretion system membrane protein PorP/SprF [Bacteroidia bacterium]